MLIIGVQLKVYQLSYINFGFYMMTLCVVGGISKKYALNKQALPSLWHVQAGTNIIEIKVVALEEANFLFLEKPRCPLVN
jgi:hypothetical protein